MRVEAFVYGNEDFLEKNSDHAMAVHEYGDVTSRNGLAIGSIYEFGDDNDHEHGCPDDSDRFTGDMGNWRVNSDHVLVDGKTLDKLNTYNSSNSIIGRSVSIKTQRDPCSAGFTGSTYIFGAIGLAGFAPNAVGIKLPSSAFLNAYIYGSGACYRCNGKLWATQESDNFVRIIGKVTMPAVAPNAHQFAITQYGDISTRSGDLMGYIWENGEDVQGLPGQLQSRRGNLGNNQFYVEYDDDDEFTDVWIEVTVVGRLSDFAGRGIQVHESYDRGDRCRNGGGGRIFAFGVFGIGNPSNAPPSLPPNLENVGALDRSFCAGGFLGVGLTSLVGLLVALFLAM